MALDLTDIENTIDVYCVDDFLPHMPEVRGRVALAQRIARRLITPRGTFPFWPNDGTDMRAFLLSKATTPQMAAAAKAECLKDEQVEDARVEAEFLTTTSVRLMIYLEDSLGPWSFTMTIDEAAAALVALQTEVA